MRTVFYTMKIQDFIELPSKEQNYTKLLVIMKYSVAQS